MRLLDIFAGAAAGKLEENGRKSFIRKASDQLDQILDLASPFAIPEEKTPKKQDMTLEQQAELLSKLNASADKSIDGIIKTMAEAAEDRTKKAS